MRFPFVPRRAFNAIGMAHSLLRAELVKAQNERDAALRDLRRTRATLRATAARLDEVTAANQSYDKPAAS